MTGYLRILQPTRLLTLFWQEKNAKSSSSSSYLEYMEDQLKDQLPDTAMLDSSEVHNYDKTFSLMHIY